MCALAAVVLTPSGGPAQHVHGLIKLGIVLEGGALAVSLNAPLSDVVGFEHAPESDEQRARIREAAATLSNAQSMFGLAESAACTVSNLSVDGPAYVTRHLAKAHAHTEHEHHDPHESQAGESEPPGHGEAEEHSEHHEHGEHSEHSEHNEHSEHSEHSDSGQHAEIDATYEWACANASKLDAVALHFTDSFVGVETIEIQILTASGAYVVTAQGRAASVSLSPP